MTEPQPEPRTDDGFTLVELLVTMLILGIFMAAVSAMFISSLGVTRTVQEATNNSQDVARAVETMNRTVTVAIAPSSSEPAIKIADKNRIEFYANFQAGRTDLIGPTLFKYEFNSTKKCLEETRTIAVKEKKLMWKQADAVTKCVVLTDTPPVFTYYDRPYTKNPDGTAVAPINIPLGGLTDVQMPIMRQSIVMVEGEMVVGDPANVEAKPAQSKFRATLVNVLTR